MEGEAARLRIICRLALVTLAIATATANWDLNKTAPPTAITVRAARV
jgi:hypothetical protein